MKRTAYTWTLATADGAELASGVRYAKRTAREAAEKALGDRCRARGTYANRVDLFTWVETTGDRYKVTVSTV